MGARGPTGAAHSPTKTPDRVIERISNEREKERRRRVEQKKKKESEPLINILISASHVPCVFVSLTVMICRDNACAVASTKFQMSNNTPS